MSGPRQAPRQRLVRGLAQADPVLDDDQLLRRLLRAETAPPPLLERAVQSGSVSLLVTAAVLSSSPAVLDTARGRARVTRDRQLVVLAEAHLCGDDELFDAQVRDHLADFPDSLVAGWLAARRSGRPTDSPDRGLPGPRGS